MTTHSHNNSSSSLNATNLGELSICQNELSQAEGITFTVLSLTCGVLAVGGNFALIVALYRTSTVGLRVNNYFIGSLAFADFLIGLTMTPLYICYALATYVDLWVVKLESFLWIVTVTATTYSLIAVSLDRLISVLYPLRYHQLMTEKRCRSAIALIWFGSFIFGFPRLVIDDINKLRRFWISCSVSTVVIPLIILCLCYGRIYSVVHKQNRTVAPSELSTAGVRNKKAVKTIGIIVSLFIITFTPSAVVYFLLLFEKDFCQQMILNHAWIWVAFVSFTHSAFNPWVYGLRYPELRNSLKHSFVNSNI
ncbi:adenosine receptor A2b-like [Stylophora pistillata]|uniref:adenosine receptor A2b-like n=1 Tax=Stylophora pistillata TaxID=50429 RepID=UPI000C0482ED|nr:adenosine receptor A2b-like [Stylophora pistillata]